MKTNSDQQPPVLKVTTTTWVRDSHDLFDYETRHVDTKTFYIRSPMKAFRKGTEVTLQPDHQPHPDDSDYLVRLTFVDGKYQVGPAERNASQGAPPKKLWLIVKDLKKPGHFLQESDMIKLGRFKLRVRQCVKSGDAVPELKLDEGEVPDVSGGPEDGELSQRQCRICLLEGSSEEGPLIAPCNCRGSIKFVHVSCLCRWIKGKLSSSSESSESTFFYRQQNCELCKANFPAHGHNQGEKVAIVEVPRTRAPFLVLENAQHNNKGLHVISMAEKRNLKLGRGHESDVRIADVSISRYHATIQFEQDDFVLEDYNSKFGTLVAIRSSQTIDIGAPVSVQVGRTAVSLSIEENPTADMPIEGVAVESGDNAMVDTDEKGAFYQGSQGVKPARQANGEPRQDGTGPMVIESLNSEIPGVPVDPQFLHMERFPVNYCPSCGDSIDGCSSLDDFDDDDDDSVCEYRKSGLVSPPTEAEDNVNAAPTRRASASESPPRRRLSSSASTTFTRSGQFNKAGMESIRGFSSAEMLCCELQKNSDLDDGASAATEASPRCFDAADFATAA